MSNVEKDKQGAPCASIIADVLTSQYELWKSACNELCVREYNELCMCEEMERKRRENNGGDDK